jgi:thiamine-phosphate diphosphorylase
MRLCLVTDRRRLAPGGASPDLTRRCLVEQARHAVSAGIDLIQLRERDLDAADLFSLAADLLRITRGTPTRLVINDRLDVALACGADGVHLRAGSMPAAAARRLAPASFLIGRSVHSVAEAVAAAGADYLIAGTVFPTVSKEADAATIGVEGLQAIVRAASVPILAIGGITYERAGLVARTGAAGIAAIGLFLGPDPAASEPCLATPLLSVADALRRRFDSGEAPS